MFKTKQSTIIALLPFAVLVLGLVVRLLVVVLGENVFIYDEMVVTQISRQPVDTLLQTVKAEPHPPGFYLLLKLAPSHSPLLTRLLIILTSFGLTMLSLVFLYKTKLVGKYSLQLGLAFWFASYTFLNISSAAKQDALAFPVLMLVGSLALFVATHNKSTKHLALAHFLAAALLGLGYIMYFQTLAVLGVITLVLRMSRAAKKLMAGQLAVFAAYTSLYGLEQAMANRERFAWLNENNNSLFQATSVHLSGMLPTIPVVEIIVLCFFVLVFVGVGSKAYSLKRVDFYFFVLAAVPVLVAILYMTQGFVRIRYSATLFLLLSIIAGWALSHAVAKFGQGLVLLLVPFFTIALAGHILTHRYSQDAVAHRVELLKEAGANEKYGVLDANGGLFTQVAKTEHGINDNIIPINIYYPKLYEEHPAISFETLSLEGSKPFELTGESARKALKENDITRFMYFYERKERNSYIDRDLHILSVLSTSCSLERSARDPLGLTLIFKDCDF